MIRDATVSEKSSFLIDLYRAATRVVWTVLETGGLVVPAVAVFVEILREETEVREASLVLLE